MLYRYKAITKNGENVQGTYEASSENEVIDMLRYNKYYPVDIKKGMRIDIFNTVSMKEISIFCRQFCTMLNAGVTIITCLDVLCVQAKNEKFKRALKDIYRNIQKGSTFSNSLRNHNKIFPEFLINMVEAGEVSGNLDKIMDRMAVYYEKENKIRNKIKGAMAYPILLFIVTIVVTIFLLIFVMPIFIDMFESYNVELPALTRVLLFICNALINYWYVFIIGGTICIAAFLQFIKNEAGKRMIDRLKFMIPIVRGTTEKIVTTRFTITLSTLLYSGVPLIQALENTKRVIDNKIVERKLKSVIEEVASGESLAHSIKKIGVFPYMVTSMIEVGEEAGALDVILDKTADYFEDEYEIALQKFTTMLEPLMICVMSIMIGFLVISIVLPMFDMINIMEI